jgi:hypothetical protein
LVVRRFGTNLKSITETLGVGTRMATPSSSGRTKPTALAAPVEVGIMLRAAARAVEVLVLVHLVERGLIVGVGMHRGHESFLNPYRIVEHFGDWH